MIDISILKELRTARKWTIQEVAERIDMNRNRLAKAEKDANLMSVAELQKYCDLLGMEVIVQLKPADK